MSPTLPLSCPSRLHSRKGCFACPHDLSLVPSPPSPVSFPPPSGFLYVPFRDCPITGWSWGEQYPDWCWLPSTVSARQNSASRGGNCFGKNVPIASLLFELAQDANSTHPFTHSSLLAWRKGSFLPLLVDRSLCYPETLSPSAYSSEGKRATF